MDFLYLCTISKNQKRITFYNGNEVKVKLVRILRNE